MKNEEKWYTLLKETEINKAKDSKYKTTRGNTKKQTVSTLFSKDTYRSTLIPQLQGYKLDLPHSNKEVC